MTAETDARPAARAKVFCVGFQKTGTTTLEKALQMLGMEVASVYGRDLPLGILQETYVEEGLRRAGAVDAVQDMPWPLLFRELDAAFPDARFVLTTRSEDGWWRSILGHFGANGDVMQALTYGEDADAPLGHEARYRRVFREHNEAVRAHFAGREGKLLELDLTRGADWQPLCGFLGIEPPAEPFPFANQRFQTPSRKREMRRKTLGLANAALRPFERD